MKKIFVAIIAALAALSLVAAPVYADIDINNNEACDGWDSSDPNYQLICGKKGDNEEQAQERVKNILNTVFLWVGIIAVIVIIIGGVFYVVSQGDPAKVARAKATILYSVIGLLVVLLSFAIVNFVLTNIK
jgi:hypothetical protein